MEKLFKTVKHEIEANREKHVIKKILIIDLQWSMWNYKKIINKTICYNCSAIKHLLILDYYQLILW